MTTEECWEFLRLPEFGRMAFHLAEQVHITPINYAVDGETLLFRTAEGSKLLAVVMNPDIAFEIDALRRRARAPASSSAAPPGSSTSTRSTAPRTSRSGRGSRP